MHTESRSDFFDLADRTAIKVFGAIAFAAVLVSLAFVIVGLFEILVELVFYFRSAPSLLDPEADYPTLGPAKAVMIAGLQLVELFLLAPLPYLIARTTALFFQESRNQGKEDVHAFLGVKSLVATLLIGFIAASIAADVIEGDLEAASAFAAATVMLVLVGYLLVLELASRPRPEDRNGRNSEPSQGDQAQSSAEEDGGEV